MLKNSLVFLLVISLAGCHVAGSHNSTSPGGSVVPADAVIDESAPVTEATIGEKMTNLTTKTKETIEFVAMMPLAISMSVMCFLMTGDFNPWE